MEVRHRWLSDGSHSVTVMAIRLFLSVCLLATFRLCLWEMTRDPHAEAIKLCLRRVFSVFL